MKKKSVFLKIDKDLEIIAQGNYESPKKEINFSGKFNITKIDIVQGTLIDYSNWIESLMWLNKDLNIMDHISELGLIKLNDIS